MDSNDLTSDATQGTRDAPHTIAHCDGSNTSEMSFELGPPSPHVLPDLSFEAIFNSTCEVVEGQVWETRQVSCVCVCECNHLNTVTLM